jgi:ribosomal protein L11 methyltransferase
LSGPTALVAVLAGDAPVLRRRLGAGPPEPIAVEIRAVGRNRMHLAAAYAAEPEAASVVTALRAEGYRAMLRPPAGGRLAAWTSATRPVAVSERLWVAFPWSEFDRDAAPASAAIVEVDPGAAFGAGTHPSTRLLLAALAERVAGGETVLDVGCGSGVLAVSAAALGASGVVAVDIEPAALPVTLANAMWNGVANRVAASTAALADVPGAFAIVVANIGAAALTDLAADLWGRVAPGGWLGLSGLSPAQLSTVGAAFPAARVLKTPHLDDWSALILANW